MEAEAGFDCGFIEENLTLRSISMVEGMVDQRFGIRRIIVA
jgi:hypothetical protein